MLPLVLAKPKSGLVKSRGFSDGAETLNAKFYHLLPHRSHHLRTAPARSRGVSPSVSTKSVFGIPGTRLQPTPKMLGRLGKDLKRSSSGIPSAAGGQVTWEV